MSELRHSEDVLICLSGELSAKFLNNGLARPRPPLVVAAVFLVLHVVPLSHFCAGAFVCVAVVYYCGLSIASRNDRVWSDADRSGWDRRELGFVLYARGNFVMLDGKLGFIY